MDQSTIKPANTEKGDNLAVLEDLCSKINSVESSASSVKSNGDGPDHKESQDADNIADDGSIQSNNTINGRLTNGSKDSTDMEVDQVNSLDKVLNEIAELNRSIDKANGDTTDPDQSIPKIEPVIDQEIVFKNTNKQDNDDVKNLDAAPSIYDNNSPISSKSASMPDIDYINDDISNDSNSNASLVSSNLPQGNIGNSSSSNSIASYNSNSPAKNMESVSDNIDKLDDKSNNVPNLSEHSLDKGDNNIIISDVDRNNDADLDVKVNGREGVDNAGDEKDVVDDSMEEKASDDEEDEKVVNKKMKENSFDDSENKDDDDLVIDINSSGDLDESVADVVQETVNAESEVNSEKKTLPAENNDDSTVTSNDKNDDSDDVASDAAIRMDTLKSIQNIVSSVAILHEASVSVPSKTVVQPTLPQPPPLKRAPTHPTVTHAAKKPTPAEAKKAPAKSASNEMRPSVQFVYDIGLSLAKQMVYRELIETQAIKERSGKLNDDGRKQLGRLRAQSLETDEKTSDLRMRYNKKCIGCNFRSESLNVLYWHKEYPHEGARDELYCAHCNFTTWNRLKYTQHMEQRHGMQGRLFPKSTLHCCPTCQFDSNAKNNFLKHSARCGKTFNIRFNLIPSTSLHVNFSFSEGFFKTDKPVPKPPPLKTAPPQRPTSMLRANTALQLQQRLLRPPPNLIVQPNMNTLRLMQQQHRNTAPGVQSMLRAPIMLPYGKLLIPQGNVIPAVSLALQQIPQAFRISNTNMRPMTVAAPGRPPGLPRQPVAKPQMNQLNQVGKYSQRVVQQPVPAQGHLTPPTKPQQWNVKPSTVETIGNFAAKNNLVSCEICGGFVKDRTALRVHFHFAHKLDLPLSIINENTAPPFLCRQCKVRFWTQTGLSMHMKATRHSNATPAPIGQCIYACFVCKQKVQFLLNHMSAVHNLTLADFVNARRCCICNMSFPINDRLIDHLKNVHRFDLNMSNSGISIKFAPQGIIAPTTYSQKILQQSSQCTLCKANFANNNLLTQHCLRVHCNCSQCGVIFRDKLSYDAHSCKTKKMNCCLCNKEIRRKRFGKHVMEKHLKACRVNLKRYNDEQLERLAKHPRIEQPNYPNLVFTSKPNSESSDRSMVQQPKVVKLMHIAPKVGSPSPGIVVKPVTPVTPVRPPVRVVPSKPSPSVDAISKIVASYRPISQSPIARSVPQSPVIDQVSEDPIVIDEDSDEDEMDIQ